MEVLAKSKGGNVSDRLKEAGGNAVSRRTETSYKAERLGKAAPHVEAQDSGRTVNDAVVNARRLWNAVGAASDTLQRAAA